MKKMLLLWMMITMVICSSSVISAEKSISKEIKTNYELAVAVLIEKNLVEKNELFKNTNFNIEPWIIEGITGERYFRDFDSEGVTLLVHKEGYTISYYMDDARDILNIYDYENGNVSESTMDMGRIKKELSMYESNDKDVNSIVTEFVTKKQRKFLKMLETIGNAAMSLFVESSTRPYDS